MKQSLKNLADIRMGHAFRSRIEPEPGGQVAVIQMKDINNEDLLNVDDLARLSSELVPTGAHLKMGDIIFKSRGARNTAAFVTADIGPAIAVAPLMQITVTSDRLLPAYLQWYLNHPATQRRLDIMPISTTGRMISTTALRDFEIEVPSLETQQKIVTIAGLQRKEQQLTTEIANIRQKLWDEILLQHAKRGRRDSR